ncbi:hypothetical protein BDV96DRAFT_592900 [Lophiotrema nucula]|uniref:Uncharacterized protein n=1 Tax=Lophiotrema nucula TaxID=690887 RepID=A0A6A5YE78_9PLEO|nr:hypothetical protein BDV96DRAFT_592900 [Lophiotrema nucula]
MRFFSMVLSMPGFSFLCDDDTGLLWSLAAISASTRRRVLRGCGCGLSQWSGRARLRVGRGGGDRRERAGDSTSRIHAATVAACIEGT